MMTQLPHVWPTVVHMLADAARLSPEHEALRCGDEVLNYRAFVACVSGLAHELQALGVGRGDRVVLLMGNSADIAIATFGVQAAGAQVVPLNPAYTASELTPMLQDAAAAAIIHDSDTGNDLSSLLAGFAPARRIAVGAQARRLTAWQHQPQLAATLPLPDPQDLSTLQYTGGTTGRSKGVNLSHAAVALNVSQREALLPTRQTAERVLAITPLFHVYAVAMCLYLAVYCRGTMVILPRYRPDDVLRTIEQQKITLLSGSPTIFIGLMGFEGFEQADLTSLRLCFSGSSALSQETLRRWEAATGCIICEGYGQSEAGPVLTYNPVDGVRKLGTVGIAVPETRVEIVDIETGMRSLPVGEIGEIRARGPQIMLGYRHLPEQTAETLRDGWLYTGDIGHLDADGYLTISDRKKDMAIIGGYNVYPREVEEALFTHPEVREAAVVGVPDDYRGEALVAFVVATRKTLTEKELLDFLATRLVRYKVPREIRIAKTLPKTTVGKLDRKALRDDLISEAGATSSSPQARKHKQ